MSGTAGPHDAHDWSAQSSVDPDLDAGPRQLAVLLVIAAGGVLGAEARYGLGRLWPHAHSAFAWSTVVINVSGSFLLGALITWIAARGGHGLLRPFAGTGVLGGYTTFSTFALDVHTQLHAGRAADALGYLALTVASCAVAVVAGVAMVRWACHPADAP